MGIDRKYGYEDMKSSKAIWLGIILTFVGIFIGISCLYPKSSKQVKGPGGEHVLNKFLMPWHIDDGIIILSFTLE